MKYAIVKFMALAVLLSVMQASPPVPRETADNPTETATYIKSKSQSNQAPTTTAPSPVKTDSGGPSKPDGHQQGQQNEEHSVAISKFPPVSVTKDWADWGVWAFSGLLVIVGFLQVWLLLFTLHAIRKQADMMERQINKERAHIRIELKSFKPVYPDEGEDGIVQEIKYRITFFGFAYAFIDKEAFDVELSDSAEVNTRPFAEELQVRELPEVVSPSTAPKDRIEIVVTTRFEVDSLLHGKSFIHFRGLIQYHDFSEISRETAIYYVWRSWGPQKGKAILGGGGYWREASPTSNRAT
jgi:hypothetical protein